MPFRTLSEFWHWMVGNIPEGDLDRGEVVFDLLHPLVLPDGDGDHRWGKCLGTKKVRLQTKFFSRYGYFVLKQPGRLDFSEEGGPTPSCSPEMSKGRGPFRYLFCQCLCIQFTTFLHAVSFPRSTRDFIKKYGMDLWAATFLVVDHNEASDDIACEWQKCMKASPDFLPKKRSFSKANINSNFSGHRFPGGPRLRGGEPAEEEEEEEDGEQAKGRQRLLVPVIQKKVAKDRDYMQKCVSQFITVRSGCLKRKSMELTTGFQC